MRTEGGIPTHDGVGLGIAAVIVASTMVGSNMRTLLRVVACVVLVSAGSRAQIPSDGLVVYYPFDGSAVDSTPVAGSTVLYNGTFVADRFGNADRALSCNGTNTRVVVADHPKFNLWNGIAVSVWVKLASVQSAGMRMVIGKSNYQDVTNYLLRIMPGGYLQWEYGIYSQTSAAPLVPDRWYHLYVDAVAPVRTRRIFIDGTMVPSDTIGSSGIHGIVPNPLTVGAAYYWTADCSEFFHGAIDELRIYNRTLTAREIASLAGNKPTDVTAGVSTPSGFVLEQNYPNPFNPQTTVRFAVPYTAHITLTVFNVLGQLVAVLYEGDVDAGYHEVRFDGARSPSGVYICRMQAGDHTETRRLLLMR